MKPNFLFKSLFLIFALVLVVSCDKDFNEIGSDLVGDENFTGNNIYESEIVAENQTTGPVQTNNLPINSLGYLNNGYFGSTTFSFVAQLLLGTLSPTYVDKPVDESDIEMVYIHIPYFSHITETDSDGNSKYELDSVIGNSKIKLSIYKSGFDLADFDRYDVSKPQYYYSNQQSLVDTYKEGLLFQDDLFDFEKDEIRFTRVKEDDINSTTNVKLAPGIFVKYDDAAMKTFFLNKVLNAPTSKLSNNKDFAEYFRGLYFKVENLSGNTSSAMARLNLAKGKIVIVYKDKTVATSTTASKEIRKTLELTMTGNTVNLFQNDGYTPPNNDDRIELKGGEGSMAILKLFNGERNNISPELKKMRDEKWLINEASITFNIDDDNASTQPKRIYLYDLQNKRPIIDYYYDSSIATNSKYNKYVYGGILVKDNNYLPSSSERGTKYKIRITNYLRSLVKNGVEGSYRKGLDSTNVRLGLVVTEAITNPSNVYLKNPFQFEKFNYTNGLYENDKYNLYIPVMSVVNPLGVKLYGATSNVPKEKRMKLEIKYAKPN